MATLHIVNDFPDSSALARCLYAADTGDAVLLISNGVYAAVAAGFDRHRIKGRGVSWFALAADVQSRGLVSRLAEGIALVDDGGFVDLVVEHQPIVSWSG